MWLQAVSILQPALAREFVPSPYIRHSTTALYAGLIVGAFFFGVSCDVVGCVISLYAFPTSPLSLLCLAFLAFADEGRRRLAYNTTLLIGGVFGLLAGAAPNFVVFCVFIALAGAGVGGNLPVSSFYRSHLRRSVSLTVQVDGTLFLEFLPGAKQWLLTLLSVWWAIGQVVASLVAVSRAFCPGSLR